MKELLDIRGIITVLNTPFTDDDQIDVESLRKNVNAAVAAGVAGFLVPAMASEVQKLNAAERKLMVKTVLEEVQGKLPVIGGASASTSGERLATAQSLINLGCEGILASIPYHNDRQYERDVREIAGLNPGFLMIQDWDFQGIGVPVPLIARLFREIDAFRSYKIEVIPAGAKYSQVLAATEGKLHVAGGWAVAQFIEALDRGVHAFMPTGMHKIYTAIFSLYEAGKRDQAKELFNQLLPVLAFSNQHLDISIHFFKRLLYAQGIYASARVREPVLPFDRYHEKIADELIVRVIELTTDVRSANPKGEIK